MAVVDMGGELLIERQIGVDPMSLGVLELERIAVLCAIEDSLTYSDQTLADLSPDIIVVDDLGQEPSGLESSQADADTEEEHVVRRKENWRDEANCLGVDAELFFPERGQSTKEAKAACVKCVARLDCLDYAMENFEEFGIWGGLSARQRRRLRKTGSTNMGSTA